MLLHTDEPIETVERRISDFAPWFYRFEFSNGAATTDVSEYVLKIHTDRAAMIFPHLDRLFDDRWGETRCLDIACHEGWFSLQLAQRGAESVRGMDVRSERIAKARWLAEVGGIRNVAFETGDLFALDPAALGTFDIVFFIGIFYHLENPMQALRDARRMTRGVCVLEGQVARGPNLAADWSGAGTAREGPGCVVLPGESEHAHEPAGIVLIPSLAALHLMLRAAGFSRVHLVLPSADMHEQYQTQNRVVLFAYA
jgi:tRNA (mo5U34)-methyltransferase